MTVNNKLSTKNLIKMQQYPSKQFLLPGTKQIIPVTEQNNALEYLNLIKTHLKETRVQRKNQRSLAVWLPDKKIVKITKLVGKILPQFGFMEDQELFLSQEESLFLMEMNKLEIFWNHVPFSIEQAYTLFCSTEEKMSRCRAFKELACSQYRLKNEKNITKHSYDNESDSDASDENIVKKVKIVSNENKNIYNRFKESGPSTFTLEKNYASFKMCLPSDQNENSGIEIVKNKLNENNFSQKVVSQNGSCILTAFCGSETVSMYQFHKIDLENTKM